MGRTIPVAIPKVKVLKAKQLQKQLHDQGIFAPLYDCILQVEQQEQNNPFRRFRL